MFAVLLGVGLRSRDELDSPDIADHQFPWGAVRPGVRELAELRARRRGMELRNQYSARTMGAIAAERTCKSFAFGISGTRMPQ